MFFQDIKIVRHPKTRKKVVFQCDEHYFERYAFYNLLSCDRVGHDVHIHFINVGKKFIDKILSLDLKIDLSISKEELDIKNLNFYKLKSYYFCSRYFISDYLFDNDLIDDAYITDADIIFNEKIVIDNKTLGVLYYPDYTGNLWKQTGANFLFVSKDRKDFIIKIITEYNLRLLSINFENIREEMPKYERANMYALDQVCMSVAMQSEDITSPNFLNLTRIEKFLGNKDMTCKIWSLTARKNEETQKILEDRFKQVFSLM